MLYKYILFLRSFLGLRKRDFLKFSHISFYKLLVLIILTGSIFELKGQVPGSLFMLHENFHAQIVNPSYQRDDNAVIIAFPALAGFAVRNFGTKPLANLDFKRLTPEEIASIADKDFEKRDISHLSESAWLPLVYVSLPVEKGRLSFYVKENVNSWIKYPGNAVLFFKDGNLPEIVPVYYSGNINALEMGYLEAVLGITKSFNEKTVFGIRGKILFGRSLAELHNMNFAIEPLPDGSQVMLSMKGTGKLSIPSKILQDEEGRIQLVEKENAVRKYISNFRNPGFAFDVGFTFDLSASTQLTLTLADLGFVWYRYGTYQFWQNEEDVTSETNVAEILNVTEGEDYILPVSTLLNAKGSSKDVYRPFAREKNIFHGTAPKINLHLQHFFTENFSAGITNQSVFYQNNTINVLSGTVLQQFGEFKVFGGTSLYGIQNLTVGGGIQWESRFSQIFVAADNAPAVFKPLENKSFSVSAGINLLLNKEPELAVKKASGRKGKISPYYPFYRKYK